jgi:hypothetical protein
VVVVMMMVLNVRKQGSLAEVPTILLLAYHRALFPSGPKNRRVQAKYME